MIKNILFPEYTLDTIINDGISTNIYRGTAPHGTPVIIKILKDDYPCLEAIAVKDDVVEVIG
ncbi:hypothetical protein NIES4071_33530 [Calothrix sp. NIES-4071]|nr:hypothetical protein NIES4071_33530 [Calothrix sp. NIES-4071]BAZ57672.1 hypothetical protein NIES4105_33460 [Calothrix sp. NIES-4105]